ERLKDLGQPETAVLAACATQEVSQVQQDGELSVMTAGLMNSIRHAAGILTLKQGAADCAEMMRQYFDEQNRQRQSQGGSTLKPHQPVLYDYCSRPALLKP